MFEESFRPIFGEHLPDVHWIRQGQVYIDPLLDPHLKRCVYRYTSIPEAISLLVDGRWSFVRPNSWPDKYEQHIGNTLFGRGGPFSNVAAYVKCFSLEYSSEAMWRTYATTAGLVRLGIRLDKLISDLANAKWPETAKLYVGRARYMKQSSVRKEVTKLMVASPKEVSALAMRALLMKRAGFSYENEIRFCFVSKSKSGLPNVRDVSGLKPENIAGMLLDPYIQKWQADQFRMLFKRSLSVPFKVSQSVFDSDPEAMEMEN
jgi:hypothetical protein